MCRACACQKSLRSAWTLIWYWAPQTPRGSRVYFGADGRAPRRVPGEASLLELFLPPLLPRRHRRLSRINYGARTSFRALFEIATETFNLVLASCCDFRKLHAGVGIHSPDVCTHVIYIYTGFFMIQRAI